MCSSDCKPGYIHGGRAARVRADVQKAGGTPREGNLRSLWGRPGKPDQACLPGKKCSRMPLTLSHLVSLGMDSYASSALCQLWSCRKSLQLGKPQLPHPLNGHMNNNTLY